MILTTDYGVDVMVKYIVLVLIGCLLIAQSVEAETKNTRQLGIGFGLFTMRSQDNLASPFTYNGDGRGWLIKYRAQNAKRRHHISLMWDTGLLLLSFPHNRWHSDTKRIQVRYAYTAPFGLICLDAFGCFGVLSSMYLCMFAITLNTVGLSENSSVRCNLQSHCNLNGQPDPLYLMTCLFPRSRSYYGVIPTGLTVATQILI